ncbi:uncharacterized protein N7443_008647 [Penicillium atrosanguineum]|uniref:BZIP domain-containing protein n=1 Tax=Penicillium atrosanguineum TaxID=1132637 RepID=A0A9W9PPG3_9EURO|nr:uncharacterized protein N7443_008647 [Penicillium atrosanguineum]KAJ5125579.1 hypothetical protein N7526_007756 [Penicillium atrosanguineum]KAJ5292694.1 hypothetical protein N7443_008647 [Penicillium atrosanguineum]KAJ5303281.1 hypothetical protein N7476_010080 [Penicillium atrosanguineum]
MAEVMAETKPTIPGPRKRGRPRTVTDDQDVPERRRKQLRVAQQAYRRRKENTINDLQTRVQEMEEGIEEISQCFLSFSNLLIQEDLLARYPRIASALQNITRQCVALAKQGCDEDENPAPVEPTSTPNSDSRKKSAPQNNNFSFDLDALEPVNLSLPDESLRFPFNTRQWPVAQPLTPPYQEQAILPFGVVLSSPPMSLSPPVQQLPSPPPTISPASLVKEERWTLSQRIVRECCENGYRLLVDQPDNEAKIQEIFGKPLTLSERDRLISAFYMAMNDDVIEAIELKTKVLNPLYNKREDFSPDMLSRSSRTWQLVLESGPDEWLDASGVQRYLQQRGIHIDSSSRHSPPRIEAPSEFNLSTFLKILSLDCICVGPGPAFRKAGVEQALQLATSHNPWDFMYPKFMT